MSIKRILAFALLLLLTYCGAYMVFYGTEQYVMFSGPERDFNKMSSGELQPKLNIKGNIETVTECLYQDYASSDILGIPVKSVRRFYYVMPIGYQEDHDMQQYCVIAVSDPDDLEVIEKLRKKDPVPLDPNAPRFEFRGMCLDMSAEIYQRFREYLQNYYYVPEEDFFVYPNISYNLIPYTIYVKGKNDDSQLTPIIVGGVCAVLGIGLFILLAIRTYKKAHMYD